jgi:hypothetical protein
MRGELQIDVKRLLGYSLHCSSELFELFFDVEVVHSILLVLLILRALGPVCFPPDSTWKSEWRDVRAEEWLQCR